MFRPLESVLYRDGATMVERNGRRVAVHFGSPPAEEAVCLKAVGLADRSDRTTLELRGDVDAGLMALAELGERAWSSYDGSDRALIRCEYADTDACLSALSAVPGATARDATPEFAAIALVGPNAEPLLATADLPTSAVVLHEEGRLFEVLVRPAQGATVWDLLLEAGAPFQIACVGLDAIEHLTTTRRLTRD